MIKKKISGFYSILQRFTAFDSVRQKKTSHKDFFGLEMFQGHSKTTIETAYRGRIEIVSCAAVIIFHALENTVKADIFYSRQLMISRK